MVKFMYVTFRFNYEYEKCLTFSLNDIILNLKSINSINLKYIACDLEISKENFGNIDLLRVIVFNKLLKGENTLGALFSHEVKGKLLTVDEFINSYQALSHIRKLKIDK